MTTVDLAPGIRGFWAALPRAGRFLLSTVALQHLGRGMTLPFTIIYLHEVRGFSLQTSGALMAMIAAVAVVLAAPAGVLVDRVGARYIVIASSISQSLGAVVMAAATTVPVAALGCFLMGVSQSSGWAAANTLISSIVKGALRQRYFGVNFALLNLGIGVGGIIAGLVVDVERPITFEAIFVADAILMLIPVALLLGPLRAVHGRSERPADSATPSYATVLRLPGVRWLLGLGIVASVVGYGQMEAGFPAFARAYGAVDTRIVGLAFAANTGVIVLTQFAVLHRIEGHRRTRVVLVMLVIWALSWLSLGASGLLPATLAAAVLVVGYAAIFGFGETLLQPTLPAITNDLAPDHLRGRMNAVSSASFMGGAVIGPVIAGQLLGHDLPVIFIIAMLAGLAMCAWLTMGLERRITPTVNGLPERVSAS
ncbi:MFS transporter [Janibacter sp. GXQ6167]|uniref:MFS transporter n=1 Tax=Janibacter sp. GXQ6167 TaxID=3240791 RepID=UPI003524DBEE